MKFRGNEPDPTKGWRLIGAVYADGLRWNVYIQPRAGDWVPVKVCADGYTERKANFWLAHNRFEDRLARSSAALILHTHRPALADALMTFLRAHDAVEAMLEGAL